MLHYLAMDNTLRKLYVIPVLLVMLMAACSSPSEDAASSNNNAAQSSNTSVAQPAIAQNGTPTTDNANASTPTAPVAQPLPEQPGNKQPAAQPAAQPATKDAAGKAPKLIAPSKTIEFGKQPKDKTLVRSFQIRNTGSAALQIEDVKPG